MILSDKGREFLKDKSNEIAHMFWSDVTSRLREREELDQAIESPVEQLFFIEWVFMDFYRGLDDFPFYLDSQYKDKSTGKYRIDFVVDFIQEVLGWDKEWQEIITKRVEAPKLGIEIDGHIWHEKTKEQVQYHKERERFLVSNGWKLLRFTGSEVFKCPGFCVEEVLDSAWDLRKKYHKELKREFKERKKNG